MQVAERAAGFDRWNNGSDEVHRQQHWWQAQPAAAVWCHERQLFWRCVLENAAASEVAVNVCLPCVVCSRRGGLWERPSESLLSVLVLSLNLLGCFAEGFCKSARLLSQTLRHTQAGHQRVFVVSQGLSDGFLNVVTSFPDVAGSASSIVASSRSWLLGIVYCLLHLVGGVLVYRWGRGAGWRCAHHRWQSVVRFSTLWPPLMRGLVLLAFIGSIALSTEPSVLPAGDGESASRGRSSAMPLDLHAPGLPGVSGARIGGGSYGVSVPPLAVGLLVGICMSASGAFVATIFCTVAFHEHSRPAARFATNLAATVLTLLAQSALRAAQGRGTAMTLDFGDCWSFVLFKFAASFCGALSAFSGTIADIADGYFGSAPDESSLDGLLPRKGRLPLLTAAQNLLAHFGLTMVILLVALRGSVGGTGDIGSTPMAPGLAPFEAELPLRPFIRERESLAWHLRPSEA